MQLITDRQAGRQAGVQSAQSTQGTRVVWVCTHPLHEEVSVRHKRGSIQAVPGLIAPLTCGGSTAPGTCR